VICVVCRESQLGRGLTSVNFERGEMKLVAKAVPSLVCQCCGEAYVDAMVAARLLQLAEHAAELSLNEGNEEYVEFEFTNG
jgi:YgiT-type zinc finger domain-containing protein